MLRNSSHFRLAVSAAACALALCSTPAFAAPPPTAPAPIASYQSTALHVSEYGTKGKPALVFIPGLGCGPWVWNAQITRLSPSYHIYALTLPGFDGVPKLPKTPYFGQVTSAFWNLLDTQHIDAPILIGHSLGGTLALRLATQNASKLKGVIAVDGMPSFPGFDLMPAAQRQATAEQIANAIAAETHDQFAAAEQQRVLPSMITSSDTVAQVTPLVARSDPAATAQWFREDVLLDFRPDLPKATVPIVEIAPYDAATDGAPPISLHSADEKKRFYEQRFVGAPHATVVMIANSRHFIMYDQPAALDNQIDAILAAHK
ncbi:MAG: alpha/beta hydrolase [Candidatus Eremiobacteraeota bacterium]|nr:alpha/beta hydrolase [Candidatus Eremiobacteraeota bacterium]MBV9647415.1 alpha/beta hydrolase [Candidatus Eremiobacteraeota bacterium]